MPTQSTIIDSNVFDKAICYSIVLKSPGGTKKVPKSQIGEEESDAIRTKADPDDINVSKQILACDEYSAIKKLDSAIRQYIYAVSLPCPLRNGVYLIPIDLVERLDKEVGELLKKREAAIEKFLAHYPTLKAEKKASLGPLYVEGEYPTVETLRQAFGANTTILEFGVPGKLKSISKKLYDKEKAKITSMWEQNQVEIQAALREGFQELISRAVNTLSVEDGKKKKFHGVENLIQFMELFDKRNIINDEKLAELVRQARNIIGGHSNEEIKDLAKGVKFRQAVHQSFAAIAKKLDTLVEETRREIAL